MASLSLYLEFYISAFSSLLNLLFARLFTPQAPPQRDLTGQTAIVTGSNNGIGLWIAIRLARQGANVCLACRNQEKGDAAVSFIKSQLAHSNGSGAPEKPDSKPPGDIFCWKVDVGDMQSVRDFCTRWHAQGPPIDMLVHNAGIPDIPRGTRRLDEQGRDIVYVTNVLGSFLMTHLLEPRLSSTARVVFTSSGASYSALDTLLLPRPPRADNASPGTAPAKLWRLAKQYLSLRDSAAPVYAQTKAHQVLFAALLQQHFSSSSSSSDTKRTAHAFTPGFTQSPIFGKFDLSWRTYLYDPGFVLLKFTEKYVATETDEGAKTGAWLAVWGDDDEAVSAGGALWEWMTRRVSVVDFVRGKMGEQAFKTKAMEVWREWERDAGCTWDIAV